jgi:cell division protein FtsL
MLVLLLVACVASALNVVHTRQKSRRAFIELSRLESERDELNTEFGRLQLEQATWTDTNRLEQIARGQLGMLFPGPAETVVIRN